MKSPLKILTVAAVATALVGGGLAGAAPAFADTEVTVTPTIAISNGAVTVPAFTASAPITINTNAGYYTDITAAITYNGAAYSAPVYQDEAGNATVDLVATVSRAVFNYSQPAAGTYSVTFTSAADDGYDFSTDPTTHITYLPAASAPVAFTITKLSTKITGWKTKSKSAKHGKEIKISSPKIANAGSSAKWVFQYKKKGSKTWHTSETGTLSYAVVAKQTFKTHAFNTIKHKVAKRGTYYFRFVVKSSAFITGAKTKQIKLTWK